MNIISIDTTSGKKCIIVVREISSVYYDGQRITVYMKNGIFHEIVEPSSEKRVEITTIIEETMERA